MARLQSFRAQVDLAKSRLLGETRRQMLVQAAREAHAEASAINTRALGHPVESVTIVDGRRGAPVESVKAGGVVVHLFAVHQAAIEFTAETLSRLSPWDTGLYENSHLLLVNGEEVEWGVTVGVDDVATFVNLLPYARRLEQGWSDQAPDGVYEVASEIVRARFGNIVNVRFGYRHFVGREAGKHRPTEAGKQRASSYPFIELSPKGTRSRR
ncbi:hypothetical protein [Azospirillum argentinense]|uniref:Uncharacterized protein n=1 Tax=Azospirillum brasilense TaxID=192 RepID=A0A4D8PZY2_AZOBR|nr:hypothetical protein [Azospirillum argentinense]QCO03031.1 hypothetical protein D3867_14025 [Azospirillum argentinense]